MAASKTRPNKHDGFTYCMSHKVPKTQELFGSLYARLFICRSNGVFLHVIWLRGFFSPPPPPPPALVRPCPRAPQGEVLCWSLLQLIPTTSTTSAEMHTDPLLPDHSSWIPHQISLQVNWWAGRQLKNGACFVLC
uniref:Uncharacterized protein n=1 Tax=Molossus molossus TaxID=27622 RepID=A0A7J8J0A9_MOLMO|nr:hypothetical protein HJG59_010341 [Molossus molossus]